MASFPQKSGPVAFGRNGAFRDQKSRGRLPERAVQGFEIIPVRQIDELAELRLDRAQGLHIQRPLIDGRRSGHRACGKNRQSEGGREKRLFAWSLSFAHSEWGWRSRGRPKPASWPHSRRPKASPD